MNWTNEIEIHESDLLVNQRIRFEAVLKEYTSEHTEESNSNYKVSKIYLSSYTKIQKQLITLLINYK